MFVFVRVVQEKLDETEGQAEGIVGLPSLKVGDIVKTISKGKKKFHDLQGSVTELGRGGKKAKVRFMEGDDDVKDTVKEFQLEKLTLFKAGPVCEP